MRHAHYRLHCATRARFAFILPGLRLPLPGCAPAGSAFSPYPVGHAPRVCAVYAATLQLRFYLHCRLYTLYGLHTAHVLTAVVAPHVLYTVYTVPAHCARYAFAHTLPHVYSHTPASPGYTHCPLPRCLPVTHAVTRRYRCAVGYTVHYAVTPHVTCPLRVTLPNAPRGCVRSLHTLYTFAAHTRQQVWLLRMRFPRTFHTHAHDRTRTRTPFTFCRRLHGSTLRYVARLHAFTLPLHTHGLVYARAFACCSSRTYRGCGFGSHGSGYVYVARCL